MSGHSHKYGVTNWANINYKSLLVGMICPVEPQLIPNFMPAQSIVDEFFGLYCSTCGWRGCGMGASG